MWTVEGIRWVNMCLEIFLFSEEDQCRCNVLPNSKNPHRHWINLGCTAFVSGVITIAISQHGLTFMDTSIHLPNLNVKFSYLSWPIHCCMIEYCVQNNAFVTKMLTISMAWMCGVFPLFKAKGTRTPIYNAVWKCLFLYLWWICSFEAITSAYQLCC